MLSLSDSDWQSSALFDKLRHFAKDITFERRHRTYRGDAAYFVRWEDVDYCPTSPLCGFQVYVTVLCWLRQHGSFWLLYVPTPSLFSCSFGLVLRTSLRDLLFRVVVSKCCVLTVMGLILLELLGTRLTCWKPPAGLPMFFGRFSVSDFVWHSVIY